MRRILLSVFLLFAVQSAFAATYYWVGNTTSAALGATGTLSTSLGGTAVASFTPGTSDIIIFDGSDISSTNGTQTGTITFSHGAASYSVAQMIFQNSAVVIYQNGTSGRNIIINGGTGTDFDLQANSTFTAQGSTLIVQILTGATGSVSGTMTLGAGSNSQSITAADANGLTINNGGSIQTNSNVAAFGAGTAGSVIFASGSTYIHASTGAANPFQLTAPSSVVTFQTGSLYKQTASVAPSMSGRTYANFEWANVGSQSPTGSGALTIDNITISAAGTFNINTTGGVTVKGNIAVNAGTLTFTPASASNLNFSGTSAQTISKTGTLTFAANAAVVIANTTAAVTFSNAQTISGTITVNSGAILATSAALTNSSTTTISGSLQLNSGGSIVNTPTFSGTSSAVIYNQGSSVNTANEWNSTSATVGAGVPQNVTIQNSTTVNTSANRALTGGVTVGSGSTFALGAGYTAGSMTVNGTLQLKNGGSISISPTYSSGALSYVSSTNGQTFTVSNEWPSSNGPTNVTVNLSGSSSPTVTMAAARSITGDLALTAGTLADAGFTIGVAGHITGTATHSGSGKIQMTGSAKNISGATFGNLELNNAGGYTLTGSPTVNNTLTLTAGALAVGTNTLTLNSSVSVGSGSLTSSATGTVSYNQGSNGQNVIAASYGNLTLSSFDKTLASSGTIGIAGTFTPGSGTPTVTGSTVNFNNSTGGQTVPAFNYNNLTVSNSSGSTTLANGGTVGIAGTFTPGSGSFTITNNTIDFNNATGGQTVPAFNYNNLTVSNASGSTTLASSGTVGVAGAFTPGAGSFTVTGSTVDFNGSGTQNIGAFTFNNLSVSAGGTKSATGALAVGGTLSISSSRTLNMGTNALSGAFTASGTGTLQTQNTTATPLPSGKTWTMDVEYNSASDQPIMNGTYAKLSALVGGNKTPDGAVTTNGDLVIAASTTLTAGTFTHTVKGNWSNSGTLTANTSKFVMQGSALQTMSGSTFYDLEINNASGVNMLTNETVSNSLILTAGVFDANGNTLTVQAGATVNRVAGSLDEAPTYGAGVNVTYSGTTSVNSGQELTPGAGSISTLAITGSGGTYTLASAPTIDHFTVSSGATLVAAANVITTSTASTVTGTLKTSHSSGLASTISGSTLTLASGSTVEFNGTSGSQTVDGRTDYENLTLSGAATKTIGSGVEVGGNFTVSGGTATPPATMTFDGASAQSIAGLVYETVAFSGNGNKTFNSDGSVATAVTFGSGSGTIDFDGAGSVGFTIRSTATNTARIGNKQSFTLSGNVKVERYYPSRRSWRLMAAPVSGTGSIWTNWQTAGANVAGTGTLITGPSPSGANGLDASTNNATTLYTYNMAGNAWVGVTDTKTKLVSDHAGYLFFVRGDRNTANLNVGTSSITTLTSTGEIMSGTYPMTTNSTADGYALLGNPYPSPIDFNEAFIDASNAGAGGNGTNTNLQRRFYVLDPAIGDRGAYVTISDGDDDGSYDVSNGSSAQTQHIQSGQAFFVQTRSSGSGTAQFSIKESHKSSTNINNVFRAGTQKEKISIVLNRVNTDGSLLATDGTLAVFKNTLSKSDDGMDADKFSNMDENISFKQGARTLSIMGAPLTDKNDTLFMNIGGMKQRNYQFSIEPSSFNAPGLVAYLEDAFTGTSTAVSLSAPTLYAFSVTSNTATSTANRFRIVFKNNSPLPVAAVNIKAFEKNNAIQVEWNVATESGVNRYEVEESNDAVNFTKAKTQLPKANDNSAASYTWVDNIVTTGANYYRVKSYGNNGEIKLSSIVKVNIGKGQTGIGIYPNPVAGGSFNLQLSNMEAGRYTIDIYNAAGQKMMTRSFDHSGGSGTHSFVLDPQLSKGVYQLVIQQGKGERTVQTIIINK